MPDTHIFEMYKHHSIKKPIVVNIVIMINFRTCDVKTKYHIIYNLYTTTVLTILSLFVIKNENHKNTNVSK